MLSLSLEFSVLLSVCLPVCVILSVCYSVCYSVCLQGRLMWACLESHAFSGVRFSDWFAYSQEALGVVFHGGHGS